MDKQFLWAIETTNIKPESSFWRCLPDLARQKPLVLYGMGDGADKLLAQLRRHGLNPAGIFASDEFVRGQYFAGLPVLTYQQAKKNFSDMVVLVCFGTERPEVLTNIKLIAKEQELYAPHMPLFGDSLFDENFWRLHQEELAAAAEVWADAASRAVYINYLSYMWTGRIDFLQQITVNRQAAWQLLALQPGEAYLDLGAYDGDTALEFAELVQGNWRHIWALEPDVKNFAKLQARLQDLPNTNCWPLAVCQKSGSVLFRGSAGRNSAMFEPEKIPDSTEIISKKNYMVSAISLDDLQRDYLKEFPTFIKMDVEGAEESVLLGGRKMLIGNDNQRPKLAVAAYHRTEDIFRLPLLLKRLNPDYQLYLRHHPYIPGWETNIYAV